MSPEQLIKLYEDISAKLTAIGTPHNLQMPPYIKDGQRQVQVQVGMDMPTVVGILRPVPKG